MKKQIRTTDPVSVDSTKRIEAAWDAWLNAAPGKSRRARRRYNRLLRGK